MFNFFKKKKIPMPETYPILTGHFTPENLVSVSKTMVEKGYKYFRLTCSSEPIEDTPMMVSGPDKPTRLERIKSAITQHAVRK